MVGRSCLALVALTVVASAQLTRVESPEKHRMSAAILRAGVDLYRTAVNEYELRGAVIHVARGGHVVTHVAIGWADREGGVRMHTEHLFRMASNTKPVVAAAVLKLEEQGVLRLDDNVRRFIGAFDNYRAGYITIRHLLTHTGGLRINGRFARRNGKSKTVKRPTLVGEVERIGRVGASVPPGTSYQYSDAGYNTLGALVEVASGMPLAEYLRKNLYRPLGMTRTTNHESTADARMMCCVYRKVSGRWQTRWRPGDPPDHPFVRGSGGMITTAADYARFCQMFLEGGRRGKRRVLAAGHAASAVRPQTRHVYTEEVRAERSWFYGFGWRVHHDGTFSHTGREGTFAWCDPKRDLVVVVLTQSRGGWNPYRQFVRVVQAACYDH